MYRNCFIMQKELSDRLRPGNFQNSKDNTENCKEMGITMARRNWAIKMPNCNDYLTYNCEKSWHCTPNCCWINQLKSTFDSYYSTFLYTWLDWNDFKALPESLERGEGNALQPIKAKHVDLLRCCANMLSHVTNLFQTPTSKVEPTEKVKTTSGGVNNT